MALDFQDEVLNRREEIKKAAQKLREKFFDWYDESSGEFDERDVKRLREDDFYCQRFVVHRLGVDNNYDHAFDFIKSILKWRKQIGVNDFKDSDFPDEFSKSEMFYPYRRDKEGNVTFMFKCKLFYKDPKKVDVGRKFFIHTLEKVDRKYGGRKRITLFYDCRGAGLSNVDFETMSFIQEVFIKRFPLLSARVLVFKMPWLFTAAWRIVKGWLPQRAVERVHFINEKNIAEFIDPEDYPEDMGGLDTTVYPLEDTDPLDNLPESLMTEYKAMIVSVH